MLKSLDLFSGVGGITHALRGLATPVMYCERDPGCIKTLTTLMHDGKLPKAPVCNDVQKLTPSSVPSGIDLIAAGFPCFVAGTMVNTTEGYTPIEHVCPTDQLISHTGVPRAIENIQVKLVPEGTTLRHVTLAHHPEAIVCTEEHPFYVLDATLDGVASFVPARSLRDGHMVGMPIDPRADIPTVAGVVLDAPEHWWVLGFFFAEGLVVDDTIRFIMDREDVSDNPVGPENENRDEAFLTWNLCKVLPDIQQSKDKASGFRLEACDETWARVLAEVGVRRIPDWVHAAPPHLVRHFIKGFMASRGLRRDNTQFVALKHVALDIQRLAAKAGMMLSVDPEYHQGYALHHVTHVWRESLDAFVWKGYVWHLIKDIKDTTTSEGQLVYNFQVAVDNSYCVSNSAVHNCVGFSNAGEKQGLKNEQSSLFSHIIRLTKTLRPPFLFLENVGAIVNSSDFTQIVTSITKTGYDMYWVVMPAYTVGAPQNRSRWFCLCVRRGVTGVRIKPTETYVRHSWSIEGGIPRLVPRTPMPETMDRRRRIRHMGNSVVPDCVRAAFLELFTGCVTPISTLLKQSSKGSQGFQGFVLNVPKSVGPLGPECRKYGSVVGSVWHAIPKPPGLLAKPDLGLVLVPSAYKPSKGINVHDPTSGVHTKPVNLVVWATPRVSNGAVPAHALTHRGLTDLATQLRFEKGTPMSQRPGLTNAEWTEWLMGFPKGWTRHPATAPATAPVPKKSRAHTTTVKAP